MATEFTYINWAYIRASKKLNSGMTAVVDFWLLADDDNYVMYDLDGFRFFNVVLSVHRKRKRSYVEMGALDVTGQDGLEPLLFALNAVRDFITEYGDRYDKTNLLVAGSDNRRHRIYERYLSREGFRPSVVDGMKCLIKRIDDVQ